MRLAKIFTNLCIWFLNTYLMYCWLFCPVVKYNGDTTMDDGATTMGEQQDWDQVS